MEDFDILGFIEDLDDAYDILVGQYFANDYCPTMSQIDLMYMMTDLSSIEVPLSVKDMFKSGE